MTSYSQRKSGARNGARLAEQAIAEEKARQQQARDDQHAERVARRKAARETEKARTKYTAADLADATHVRDDTGWHRVVRVSAKTVTVATAYTWTERIPVERVRQYAVEGKAVAR